MGRDDGWPRHAGRIHAGRARDGWGERREGASVMGEARVVAWELVVARVQVVRRSVACDVRTDAHVEALSIKFRYSTEYP